MPRTVLVADDSPTIQRVVQLAFAGEADIEVVAVSSGSQAIEQIEARAPALVLADTGMPDSSGYDVAEFVNRRLPPGRIPVVLLTGAFETIDEPRARHAGCEAVLVKPFEPAKLVTTVRDLLETVTEAPPPDPHANLTGEAELTWPVADDMPTRTPPPPAPVLDVTDELVERIATQVVARISDRLVRETTREVVATIAERMVGQEIARLKDRLRSN